VRRKAVNSLGREEMEEGEEQEKQSPQQKKRCAWAGVESVGREGIRVSPK